MYVIKLSKMTLFIHQGNHSQQIKFANKVGIASRKVSNSMGKAVTQDKTINMLLV